MNLRRWYTSAVILLFALITSCEGKVSVTTLNSRNRYTFEIHTEAFIELAAPIYCRVKADDTLSFPFVTLGHAADNPYDLEFTLIDYGNFVAIVEQSAPLVVLAIYDFQSQVSWPCSDLTMSWQEELEVGRKLLKTLQENNPNVPFILSTEFGGNAPVR